MSELQEHANTQSGPSPVPQEATSGPELSKPHTDGVPNPVLKSKSKPLKIFGGSPEPAKEMPSAGALPLDSGVSTGGSSELGVSGPIVPAGTGSDAPDLAPEVSEEGQLEVPVAPWLTGVSESFASLTQKLMFWNRDRDDDEADSESYNTFGQPFRAICTNPNCKCRVRTTPDQSGKIIQCPACSNRFYVPTISIECPNHKCGSPGIVTVDRMRTQLKCDECGTAFFFDQGGRGLVLGKYTGKYVDPLKIATPPKSKPDLPDKISKWWSKLDPRVRNGGKVGIYAVIGAVALFGIWNRFLTPGPELPPTLDGRVNYVAKALMNSEFEKIGYLMDSKATKKELDQWLEKVRPKDWPVKLKDWKITSASGQRNTKVASFRVTFTGPSAAPLVNQPPPPQVAEEGVEFIEEVVADDVDVEEELAEESVDPENLSDETVPGSDQAQPTSPKSNEAPTHAVSINFVNRGEELGGWWLDMATNLRSVGLGDPE